jgi:hypothetical protein
MTVLSVFSCSDSYSLLVVHDLGLTFALYSPFVVHGRAANIDS